MGSLLALSSKAVVFSRLVILPWSAVSSLEGALVMVASGSMALMRGSFMKNNRMWALAAIFASEQDNLTGCMACM